MNHIELSAYRAARATMTGAGFHECGFPFPSSFPVDFSRHFDEGKLPGDFKEHMGRLVAPLYDDHGLNVEVACLTSPESPHITITVRVW